MERSIVMADLPEIRLTQAPLDLAGVPTALIADCDRAPMMCMSKRSRFVGEALTIRAGSLAQWKALELAQPAGTHPASPADPTPGGIGLQLRLHEAVIDWGDVIVGDDDGLVVIPRAAMTAVLEKVSMQRMRERELQQSLLGAG